MSRSEGKVRRARFPAWVGWSVWAIVVVGLVALVIAYGGRLFPAMKIGGGDHDQHARGEPAVEDPHAGHDHGAETATHAAGEPCSAGEGPPSIQLSAQAQKNIRHQPVTITLGTFDRPLGVPGRVVESPGRSSVVVSSPMTGIVMRVYPTLGEAVQPGQPLFELRLTHEDLVDKQSSLLGQLEQRDVLDREIKRLQAVTASGAVAGKTLLERQYDKQRLEATIHAAEQALALHGLSDEQIKRIVFDRQLLRELTIYAPDFSIFKRKEPDTESTPRPAPGPTPLPASETTLPTVSLADEIPAELKSAQTSSHLPHVLDPSAGRPVPIWQVTDIAVRPGQHVPAGAQLCTLSDHSLLNIEGQAYEQDAERLNLAARERRPITAILDCVACERHTIPNLRILYVAPQVDPESRALRFLIEVPNALTRDDTREDGRRFVNWSIKPGMRVDLRVPVERIEKSIVVPAQAVVREGAEAFVYRQQGDTFTQLPVHVRLETRDEMVLENDGSLFPGDVIAGQGARQIYLAIKNQEGGGIDPHAGHSH